VDAGGSVGLDGVLGDSQDDDRHAESRSLQLFDQLQTLDATLEQGVDDDHVRSELLDGRDHLRAVGQDVEQLHAALRIQESADVLRYLRNVLDEEQARRVT